MRFQTLNRKVHYWLSAVVALPLLVIIGTGLLLQLKKQIDWVQPPEQRGIAAAVPELDFHRILAICRTVPQAGIRDWSDIHRIDVRAARGMMKVTGVNDWEVQIDSTTGRILQVAYRRSDFIESLHDGSWFHPGVKYGVFLPAAISLLLLLLTGIYLFVLPYLSRWKARGRERRPSE